MNKPMRYGLGRDMGGERYSSPARAWTRLGNEKTCEQHKGRPGLCKLMTFGPLRPAVTKGVSALTAKGRAWRPCPERPRSSPIASPVSMYALHLSGDVVSSWGMQYTHGGRQHILDDSRTHRVVDRH